MPRTSRKKRGSRKGSKKRGSRKGSRKSMNTLMTPGKMPENYDPLGLLSMGDPSKQMKLLAPNMGLGMPGLKSGLINPLVMPYTMPGIMQRKVIFTPTGPQLNNISVPDSSSQKYGAGLFTPTLPENTSYSSEIVEGNVISGGDGSEDLDTLSYLYMNNPAGFMSGLRPTGFLSTFLQQNPYYQFAKQYQHKDEAPLVFNQDHGRSGEALNVSAPGHQNAIPDRLAVAKHFDLM